MSARTIVIGFVLAVVFAWLLWNGLDPAGGIEPGAAGHCRWIMRC